MWLVRSDSASHRDRIVWVTGDREGPREEARQLIRSSRMIERYGNRSFVPGDEKQRLLAEERGRQEDANARLGEAVKRAFMAGELYFRGRQESPRELGTSFGAALTAFGNRVLPKLYPHIITYGISDRDIAFLIDNVELSAPPPVLCQGRLGLLKLDADRYEVTTEAAVPRAVLDFITQNAGVTGSTLLEHFGAPPHGVPPDVLKATVVGLLRGRRVRIELGSNELTSVFDEGARELLKETGLRKARLFVNTTVVLQPKDRNAICKVFRDALGAEVAHNDEAIANEAVRLFADVRDRRTPAQRRSARREGLERRPACRKRLRKPPRPRGIARLLRGDCQLQRFEVDSLGLLHAGDSRINGLPRNAHGFFGGWRGEESIDLHEQILHVALATLRFFRHGPPPDPFRLHAMHRWRIPLVFGGNAPGVECQRRPGPWAGSFFFDGVMAPMWRSACARVRPVFRDQTAQVCDHDPSCRKCVLRRFGL